MASLMERLRKATTLDHAEVMDKSDIFNIKDSVSTPVPGLNIAYSAHVDGGLTSGLHVWAGPSRHFKSLFCLISASSYLLKYPDAVCIFYDNEFGSPPTYFESAGIDPSRVLHSPFLSLEDLRTDISNQLKEIKRGDKVVIVVDSLGMAASNKEINDAEEGSEKADMTRAKVNKSLFRIVTPHLRIKDIPMLVVQHTYEEMKMYGKTIVSGGTGTMLAAENVYILGRQQDKEGTGATAQTVGYNFIINVEKSRYVREKSKIPITVKKEGGVVKYGGFFDMALNAGFITAFSAQKFCLVDPETGEVSEETYQKKEVEANTSFWKALMLNKDFQDYIYNKYSVANGKLISDTVELEETTQETE